MPTIELTRGMRAVVDEEDFERLSVHKWFAVSCATKFYAARNVRMPNGRQTLVLMHREVLRLGRSTDRTKVVDHFNGDTLDNRMANLSEVSQSTNLFKAERPPYKPKRRESVRGLFWNRSSFEVPISQINYDMTARVFIQQ